MITRGVIWHRHPSLRLLKRQMAFHQTTHRVGYEEGRERVEPTHINTMGNVELSGVLCSTSKSPVTQCRVALCASLVEIPCLGCEAEMSRNVEQPLNRLGNNLTNIDSITFEGWLYSLSLPDFMVPPGAEVEGSAAWAAWRNWLDRVGPPKNMDYGYCGFSGYDDTEDHKTTLRELAERVGPNSDLFTHLYREFYNDAVADLKRAVWKACTDIRTTSPEFPESIRMLIDYNRNKIQEEIECCQTALDDYHVEMLQQKFAATKLVRWYKRFPPPGVRVSETGTWIADDDDDTAKERSAFIITHWIRAKLACLHNDRAWREMHHQCQGCVEDQPNQLAHMGYGGCLETVEEELCRTCGCDASGGDYRGYCSRACRYKE